MHAKGLVCVVIIERKAYQSPNTDSVRRHLSCVLGGYIAAAGVYSFPIPSSVSDFTRDNGCGF